MATFVQNLRAYAAAFDEQDPTGVVDLSAILTRRIDVLRETYPGANVRADIPADIRVQGNEALERVFENVLQNAVEHNDKAIPEITVDVDQVPETVTVTVEDNGPGIPDAQRARLFQPELERDHTFGLYLVHTLVTLHGGTIEVGDADPEGTVVAIELPRTEQSR